MTTNDFHEESYKTGIWVGRMLGALAHGCTSVTGTWPKDAMPEHREEIEALAALRGLIVTWDERFVTVEERQAPKLEVVK